MFDLRTLFIIPFSLALALVLVALALVFALAIFYFYVTDNWIFGKTNVAGEKRPQKTQTHIFHYSSDTSDQPDQPDQSNQSEKSDECSQIITGAYQIDFEKNKLLFAGARFSKKSRAYLSKEIEQLNPLSLDYLNKKEKLEKKMNSQKSWKRADYAKKATDRLSSKPHICAISDFGNVDFENASDYRNLENFILQQFKFKGFYHKK